VWRPLGALEQAVETGAAPFERSFGKGFFDYLAGNPGDSAIFNAAMSSGSSMSASAVVAAYDFSRFRQIVDMGGGHGALLEGILSANPELRGVLFDLPSVVAGADRLRTGSLAGRCQVVGGDFFQSVPESDAYLLKGIVHDWSDGDATRILTCCRRAISADGTLLLFETVLGPHDAPASGLMDLLMLVLVGGRERTEQDFRSLLGQAGFKLRRVIPAGTSSLLECAPV
jgi:O-methyltransferase